jgi:hypothetical protein
LSPQAIEALLAARDAGVLASDAIADSYCGPARAAHCRAYLRDNIQYIVSDREESGLRAYYQLAEKHGVVDALAAPAFYE